MVGVGVVGLVVLGTLVGFGVYGSPHVLLHTSSPYWCWKCILLQVGFIAVTVAYVKR